MTTLLSRVLGAKGCFLPFHAGPAVARWQQTARYSHDALNGYVDPGFTFHAAKISDCFRMALARNPGAANAETLRNLAVLVDDDQVECSYRVRGIIVKVLPRGESAGRPGMLQIQGIDFTRNPHAGGQVQFPARHKFHEAWSHRVEPCFTFLNAKIGDCFRMAVESSRDGSHEEDTLIGLKLLVGRDQTLRQPGDCSPIECVHRVHGVTYKVLQQCTSTGELGMLQIEGSDFDEASPEQEAQNGNLQRSWSGMRRAIMEVYSKLEGVPAEGASVDVVGTWMHANQPILQTIANLKAQNENLQKSWSGMRWVIMEAHPKLEGVPAVDDSVDVVRSWMYANQPVLQAVTNLCLNSRNLTCVPEEVRLFTGLRGLFLSGNQLTYVPPDLLRGLNGLQRLYLDENQLTSLPEGFLDGLSGLQWLNLSNNQLSSLPAGLFKDLSQMKSLHLGYNRLTSLSRGLFDGMGQLEELLLCGNPLLMASWSDLSGWENHIAFPRMMDEFFAYTCKSHFAKLYQLAAGNGSPAALKRSFSAIDEVSKNAICGIVSDVTRRPHTDHPRCGEHHVCDDAHAFNGALKLYVREMFDRLPEDSKEAVHAIYLLIDGANRKLDGGDLTDPQWFPHESRRHVLRLIDALFFEPSKPIPPALEVSDPEGNVAGADVGEPEDMKAHRQLLNELLIPVQQVTTAHLQLLDELLMPTQPALEMSDSEGNGADTDVDEPEDMTAHLQLLNELLMPTQPALEVSDTEANVAGADVEAETA